MADQNWPWRRQGEDFWRAHHEAWKRGETSDSIARRKVFRARHLRTGVRFSRLTPATGAQAALPEAQPKSSLWSPA
jgi:hypothetical protein